MTVNSKKRRVYDVSLQASRYPPALEDDFTTVDHKSFAHELQAAEKISRMLTFASEQKAGQGDWSALFQRSVFWLLAEISLFYPGYHQIAQQPQVTSALARKARLVFHIYRQFDSWLRALPWCDHAIRRAIEETLSDSIRYELRQDFTRFRQIVADIETPQALDQLYRFDDFEAIWSAGQHDDYYDNLIGAAQLNLDEFVEHIRQRAYSQISALREKAEEYIQQARQQQGHEPAMSLLVTFLTLTEKLKQIINGFGARHRDHYYFDLLGLAEPDVPETRCVLQCELKPNVTTSAMLTSHTYFDSSDGIGASGFTADINTPLQHVTVATLKSLSLERDEYISPECLFGFVTRVRQCTQSTTDAVSDASQAIPVFGSELSGLTLVERHAVPAGFVVADNILLLESGDRHVDVKLRFRDPFLTNSALQRIFAAQGRISATQTEAAVRAAMGVFGMVLQDKTVAGMMQNQGELLRDCDSGTLTLRLSMFKKSLLLAIVAYSTDFEEMRRALAHLLTHQWLANHNWLSAANLLYIRQLLYEFFAGKAEQEELVEQLLNQFTPAYSKVYLMKVFEVEYSGESGWITPASCFTLSDASDGGQQGLTIRIHISADKVPLSGTDQGTHQLSGVAGLPALKITLNEKETLYGMSLFDHVDVDHIRLQVAVKNADGAVAFNEYGLLDTSKPFMPFGPAPRKGSYLQVGYYEAALKQVSDFSVSVSWSGLPFQPGGFADYYQSYGLGLSNDSFRVKTTARINNQWLDQGRHALFSFDPQSHTPLRQSVIDCLGEHATVPIVDANPERFASGGRRGNGYFRIILTSPSAGFGQEQYNSIVANHVSQSLRAKLPVDLPPSPVVPKIDSLQVSYTASKRFDITTEKQGQQHFHQVFHLLGSAVWPMANLTGRSGVSLLPHLDHDGNLFIAFSSDNLADNISLFFDLADDSRLPVYEDTPQLHWAAFTSSGWMPLNADRIIYDGTNGFSTAGVVQIALPAELARNPFDMPRDHFWLKVSTDSRVSLFPGLNRVLANCVEVRTKRETKVDMSSGSVIQVTPKHADLASISLVYTEQSSLREKSRRHDVLLRSETLRHKQRPITAWDFERLALEAFPQLHLARCFTHARSESLRPQPGHILLTVVPKLKAGQSVADSVMASSSLLRRIHDFFRQHMSPTIKLEVANPRFERVQVRCMVEFERTELTGLYVQSLNEAICNYFDIWRAYSPAIGFGWQLTPDAMAAYIQDLPYIRHVTKVSVLHIDPVASRTYALTDSAREPVAEGEITVGGSEPAALQSRFPWSLPRPDKRHAIAMSKGFEVVAPAPIGIGDMEIGNNLILPMQQNTGLIGER